MDLTIIPNHPLCGTVTLPGDKSISHRAALFAALANGESRINNFLSAGVTDVLLKSLTDLGVTWEKENSKLTVHGKGLSALKPPEKIINCGNSATTMRLLAGAIAAAGLPAILDGSQGLRRRPMARIISPLRRMGVEIMPAEGNIAPLDIKARPDDQLLKGIDYTLPVASAQVKSTILLAALAASSPTTIHEPGPSRDHTERMLSSMGASLLSQQGNKPSVQLSPSLPVQLSPLQMQIPGDFSSASFLIVAAAILPGSYLTLLQVGLNPTRTGLLDVLLSMGADIRIENQQQQCGEPVGDVTIRSSQLKSTRVKGSLVVRMIDEFPIFAVAASCAQGRTMVQDAGELRNKESDRINTISTMLEERGINIQEKADGFIIDGPNQIQGGTIHAGGDHRLAMSMIIAGLLAESPLRVEGAQIIHESFPGFVDRLKNTGAIIHHA